LAGAAARHTRVHWLMLACFAVFGVSVIAAATAGAKTVTRHQAVRGTLTVTAPTMAAPPAVARLDAFLASAAQHPAAQHPAALSGFDCRTLTHCVAIGANTPAMATQLVGEGGNDTRWWRTAAVPKPAGTGNVGAGGVACPASHQCVAVGVGYPRTGPGYFAVAAYWNGSRWSTEKAAGAGTSSLLAAVSCPLPASCYAAGEYTPKGSLAFAPLIEHWNGANWSVARVPVPKGSSYGNLSEVSCPVDRFCVAVGTDGAGALIERWDGRAWHATRPAGSALDVLYGVSCPSAASCVAVGATGSGGSLVERWDGHGWRQLTAPVPRGSYLPWLQSVSCVSPSRCLAVGDDFSPGVYAVAWNGRAWKLISMRASGPHVGYLQQVRCLAATSCVALGATTQIAATQRAESAFWNGASWKVVPTA
jgi:hypothetical protein